MSNADTLFTRGSLDDVLRALREKRVQELVEQIPRDQFCASADDQIVEHVTSKIEITPLTIYEDRMEMDQNEGKMDVSGHWDRNSFRDHGPIYTASVRVTVTIPFTGDPNLWQLYPNPRRLSAPRATIRQPGRDGVGYLDIAMEHPADGDPAGRFKRHLEETLEDLRFALANQAKQIKQFHQALPDRIRQIVERRRKYLEQHDEVKKVLDIPLKHRPGAPSVEPIKVKRKMVRPLPPAPSTPPEPGIRDEDYEHILKVMRHEGRTFEATPATFAKHDEEELRDIILAHLNGHYEGDATGESFRGAGKTDIRIESGNRAAFIGECKVWRGQKQLTEALDQLLSYLTWRDCKAALVIFNKDVAGFAGIQQKVPEALAAHANHISSIDTNQPGEWRLRFRSATDPDRRITVHVFLFNLYSDRGA